MRTNFYTDDRNELLGLLKFYERNVDILSKYTSE